MVFVNSNIVIRIICSLCCIVHTIETFIYYNFFISDILLDKIETIRYDQEQHGEMLKDILNIVSQRDIPSLESYGRDPEVEKKFPCKSVAAILEINQFTLDEVKALVSYKVIKVIITMVMLIVDKKYRYVSGLQSS